MKSIICAIACDSYWSRLRLTLHSLRYAARRHQARSPEPMRVSIAVGSSEQPPDWFTQECATHGYHFAPCDPQRIHVKADLLLTALGAGFTAGGEYDYVALLDADMLYPPDLFDQVQRLPGSSAFASGERVHLTRACAEFLCAEDPYPSEDMLRHVWPKHVDQVHAARDGVFMGWLQVLTMDLFECLPFADFIEHRGYDKFDYACAQRLREVARHVVQFSWGERPPLHLGHGDWGANWRGVVKPH